jgi:hypothetical protein
LAKSFHHVPDGIKYFEVRFDGFGITAMQRSPFNDDARFAGLCMVMLSGLEVVQVCNPGRGKSVLGGLLAAVSRLNETNFIVWNLLINY